MHVLGVNFYIQNLSSSLHQACADLVDILMSDRTSLLINIYWVKFQNCPLKYCGCTYFFKAPLFCIIFSKCACFWTATYVTQVKIRDFLVTITVVQTQLFCFHGGPSRRKIRYIFFFKFGTVLLSTFQIICPCTKYMVLSHLYLSRQQDICFEKFIMGCFQSFCSPR